ncbi:MAG: hypothetical protein Q9M13_08390 [Mariprofundales bacterium]|nr:hypothetical protein [Mariprofundales bacterium]
MMDYTMLLSDALVSSALTYLSIALYCFLRKAKANAGKNAIGSKEAEHFFEHLVAGGIGFVGCVLGAVAAVTHMVLQQTLDGVPEHVEILQNTGYTLLFIAAALFVHHMIKEEDPNHPFYYRHGVPNAKD